MNRPRTVKIELHHTLQHLYVATRERKPVTALTDDISPPECSLMLSIFSPADHPVTCFNLNTSQVSTRVACNSCNNPTYPAQPDSPRQNPTGPRFAHPTAGLLQCSEMFFHYDTRKQLEPTTTEVVLGGVYIPFSPSCVLLLSPFLHTNTRTPNHNR